MADSSAGPCPTAKSGASAVTPRFLLDTNVVSELRKPRPNGRVVAWLESLHDDQLAIRLMHRKPNTLMENALIAATAQVHGLTAATHDIGGFKALGVSAYNPFSSTAG